MAKIAYTKLNAKVNQDIKTIPVEGTETPIEVIQYLPVNEKLDLITRVIQLSYDENNFSNPIKEEVYFILNVIEFYTNITFTEKQKENVTKLYDSLYSSGWVRKIINEIPEIEICDLRQGLRLTVDAFYSYRNSVLGILETMKTDYSNLDLDIEKLQENLRDGKNIELLKEIMTKLG